MNDKWIRLVGIPLIAVIMHIVSDGFPTGQNAGWWRGLCVAFSITITIWEGNRALFKLLRHWYPGYDLTARRLVMQTLVSVPLTFAATVGLDFGWGLLGIEVCNQGELLEDCLRNLLPTLFVTSIYESVYFFGEWKKNLQRSEALARAGIQSELETLRSQLDPHFLFNSLNTLAALIDDDNEPAHTYLEQLADVYRYVLVSRDKITVPLREEMDFVEAYLYLNKTRFRDDLQVERDIAPAAYTTQVAPLSLQMLIENAIKHNVISPENPLRVLLRAGGSPEGYFSVMNNVQPKTGLEQSTKVGLRNIISRYRLLSTRPVEVLRENGLFTVKVPLLTVNS
ncbi:sensor histidine kinase [uncultured Hymenobacter sp.]|uniref:sensor histidine kinase n=1 Tax=uncultured Hymenobacter sp. TaxID=170016 RepID=UPI0035C96605